MGSKKQNPNCFYECCLAFCDQHPGRDLPPALARSDSVKTVVAQFCFYTDSTPWVPSVLCGRQGITHYPDFYYHVPADDGDTPNTANRSNRSLWGILIHFCGENLALSTRAVPAFSGFPSILSLRSDQYAVPDRSYALTRRRGGGGLFPAMRRLAVRWGLPFGVGSGSDGSTCLSIFHRI